MPGFHNHFHNNFNEDLEALQGSHEESLNYLNKPTSKYKMERKRFLRRTLWEKGTQ